MSEDAEYMRKAKTVSSEIWRMSGNSFTTVMQQVLTLEEREMGCRRS